MSLHRRLEERIINEEKRATYIYNKELDDVGIKKFVDKRNRTFYVRVFDSYDIYKEDKKERVNGCSTFISEKDIDYVLEIYKKYDLLMQGSVYSQITALKIARENLGKNKLIKQAEQTIISYIKTKLEDITEKAITETENILKETQINNITINRLLYNAKEQVNECNKRISYLESLKQDQQLDENLKRVIEKTPQQKEIKLYDDAYYNICMNQRVSYTAKMALEYAIRNNYSSSLIKQAYEQMQRLVDTEQKVEKLISRRTPESYLKALEFGCKQGLNIILYNPTQKIFLKKGIITMLVKDIEKAYRELNEEILEDVFSRAELSSIEIDTTYLRTSYLRHKREVQEYLESQRKESTMTRVIRYIKEIFKAPQQVPALAK
jgi:hypothetical protein